MIMCHRAPLKLFLTLFAGFTSPGGGIAGAVNNGVYTTRSSTTPVWPQSAQFTPDAGILALLLVTLLFLSHLSLGLSIVTKTSKQGQADSVSVVISQPCDRGLTFSSTSWLSLE